MADVPKIIHFSFLAVTTLLIGRIFAISTLDFSIYWLAFAAIAFATVYFPFTLKALDFYRLSLREKFIKFLKRALIIDIVLGVIGSIPYLYCVTSGTSECYAALFSYLAWIALGMLAGVQIATFVVIFLMHIFEKISLRIRYALFAIVILVLIYLNFNAYIIPISNAARDPNAFFTGTNQCDKLNIFDISSTELKKNGCHAFYQFDKNGNSVHPYQNTAPINAFRECYYKMPFPGSNSIEGGYSQKRVNCRDAGGESGISISYSDEFYIVPNKYMAQYGFNEDDSYFEVCKTILTDYIAKKKEECYAKN